MKSLLFFALSALLLVGCNSNNKEQTADQQAEEPQQEAIAYQSFGEQITDADLMPAESVLERFKALKEGDTIAMKFRSKVNEVCQMKGCWMNLQLGEEQVRVTFKDYGFFMPKDIADRDVIVEGMAFVEMTDVETLKHFAEDAGSPQEEIDAITEPQLTYAFVSSGVLLPEIE